jgi:NAD(P)-dependent dehydrogenase (short-subunit alcohol dehydrogenase family)
MNSSKVVFITGASCGIGKVTALELAKAKMTVILACRNEEKTRPVLEEIQKLSGNERVYFIKLDLASFASIVSCVDEFKVRFKRLDILINNAGMLSTDTGKFTRTEDNYEMVFQVNYLGHFLLTLLLLDVIKNSTPARIINVSSSAHLYTSRSFDEDLKFVNEDRGESFHIIYGRTKLYNILFSNYLAKKLMDQNIFVNSLHPGVVKTEIVRNLPKVQSFMSYFFQIFLRIFSCNPVKGAQTTLFVALSPDIEEKQLTGRYFVPPGKLGSPNAATLNEQIQQKMWDFSMEACRDYLPPNLFSS